MADPSTARGGFPPPPHAGRYAAIADLARASLLLELRTFPKPGLVSLVDAGSHGDMDAGTFRASADAIHPFFADLAAAGAELQGMDRLRPIGLAAEAMMLAATGGINTHRGAIFGLGLLCAAAGARGAGLDLPLGAIVARLWGDAILAAPVPERTHGGAALRRYGAGGARLEAAHGFPSLDRIGLPALRHARTLAPDDAEAARVQTCFALIAALEDTNLLHRAGPEGLAYARLEAGRFLADGGIAQTNWRARATALHEAFVTRRLSPGGSADMLAMTLFVDEHDRARAAPAEPPGCAAHAAI